MYKISIVGAGNVAFRMALFLQAAGHHVECVCARDLEKADKVVRALKRSGSNTVAITDYNQLPRVTLQLLL
jgi:predicted dinucleotide-binding enzyme